MMTKDSSGISSTQTPLSNDGRGRSYRPELGAAFEDRLGAAQQRYSRDDSRNDTRSGRDERKDDDRQKKAEDRDGRTQADAGQAKNGAKQFKRFGEQEQGQDGRAPFEGLTQLGANPLRGLDMVAPVASVQGMDPALIAQLDRIAAAIAEARPNGVDKQMSITFGKNDTLMQGAILTRDASGALSIHIAGLHPGVTAVQSTRLQQELRARLMARKLEVREIAFVDGGPEGRGNAPRPQGAERQG